MAIRPIVISPIPSAYRVSWSVSWSDLANTDTGTPLENPASFIRSVQISGTFGVGGSVSIEGSNDGVNWLTLTNPRGVALTFTSPRIETIEQVVRFVRPNVTAGDVSTNLTCSLLATGDFTY